MFRIDWHYWSNLFIIFLLVWNISIIKKNIYSICFDWCAYNSAHMVLHFILNLSLCLVMAGFRWTHRIVEWTPIWHMKKISLETFIGIYGLHTLVVGAEVGGATVSAIPCHCSRPNLHHICCAGLQTLNTCRATLGSHRVGNCFSLVLREQW